MKKLYQNIEKIYIKGDISQLTEAVSSIDASLQNITQATNDICAILERYSNSNQGKTYEKTVKSLNELGKKLYESSVALNDMQNQVVEYQRKVMRYEGLPGIVQPANKLLVTVKPISVTTSVIQFDKSEMRKVANGMRQYISFIRDYSTIMRNKTNDCNRFWLDQQYKMFREFIEDVCMNIEKSLKPFGEFYEELVLKLNELE